MPIQLPLTLAFVMLAAVPAARGSYVKGEEGYKNMQHLLVDSINKQIFVKSVSNGVDFRSAQALQWDNVLSKSVPMGLTYAKLNLKNLCKDNDQECKKAVEDIWDMAKKGKSPGGPGDAGIYTRCSDLKTAIGLEGQVANCA